MKNTFLCMMLLALFLFAACSESAGEPEETIDFLNWTLPPPPSPRPTQTPEPTSPAGTVTHEKRTPVLPLTTEKAGFSVYALQNPNVSSVLADVDGNIVWNEIEKRTGVRLDFTTIHPDNAASRYRFVFSGRETPDLVQNLTAHYPGSPDDALRDGVIADLAPYIGEHMPNFDWYLHRDGFDIRNALTDGGAIASIPRILEEPCAYIEGCLVRGDWLRELELDIPITYRDYLNVLREFKEHYDAQLWLPEIGDTPYNGFSGGFGTAAWLNGSDYPFFQKNGKVLFGPATAEYGEYLAMLSMWYAEGLIYEEPLGSYPSVELVEEGKIGIFMASWDMYDDYAGEVELIGAPAPVRNAGDTNHFIGDYGELLFNDSSFSVLSSCEDIPLLLRTLDYRFSDDGAILTNYGKPGETFSYTDGIPQFTEIVINSVNRKPSDIIRASFLSDPGAYPEYQYIFDFSYSEDAIALRDLWSENRDGAWQLPSTLTLRGDEIGRFETVMSAVSDHVVKNSRMFIAGERDLSELSVFISELEDMGIAFCTEIIQSAYERWQNREN